MGGRKQQLRHVDFGGRGLDYIWVASKSKVISITVKRDGRVYLHAPSWYGKKSMDSFVEEKQGKIFEILEEYKKTCRKKRPSTTDYLTGDSVYILGEECRLIVREGRPQGVVKNGNTLILTVDGVQEKRKRERVFEKWRKKQQEDILLQLCQEVYPVFGEMGIPYPEIRLRKMKSMWGNCRYKEGIITLSKSLLEVPAECIRYVIIHEFCHFKHPDHSKSFYSLLGKIMPDWEKWREEINCWL